MTALVAIWRSLHRAWWVSLWSLRPLGRMFLARTGWAARAVVLRKCWHWVFANSLTLTIKAGVWWAFGLKTAAFFSLAWTPIFFFLYQLAVNGGAPSRVMMRARLARMVFGWKLAWWFRSRWPMEWSIAAAKTRTVQAEVGNNAEPAVTIRPVFDSPKLGWWPKIDWPVISWWVSPPPGRTFEQFDQMLDILASNMANVVGMSIDYERSTSSLGRLSVLFDDPLAEPVLPEYHIAAAGDTGVAVDEDLADVVDLRPLRLVEDPETEAG